MKDQKIREALKQAQEAVEQANKALDAVMQELDLDALEQVTGAGDPFKDLPRANPHPLDDPLRDRA